VIAGREKRQAALFGAKDEADIDACPAFEVVSPKAANAQTGMKMRAPKSIADGIDCSRHLAPSRFREVPNVSPKRF
jgi:hypothetical protein